MEETPYIKIWIDNDILYSTFADKLEIDIEIAKQCVATRIAYSSKHSYPCLINMKGIKSATREARAYFANEGAEYVKAGAIIVGSALTRMLGNIFLSIDKPDVPTKLFTNEEHAKEWLKQYL